MNSLQGFFIEDSGYNLLFGNAVPYGINNHSQVVGVEAHGGFVYWHGQFRFINFPGANYTVLYGINDMGQLVGACRPHRRKHRYTFFFKDRF